jgi:hypothetical protein
MRLSPIDPQRWLFYGGFAFAHFVAGRHEEAIEWADRALHEQPRATIVVGIKPKSGSLRKYDGKSMGCRDTRQLLHSCSWKQIAQYFHKLIKKLASSTAAFRLNPQ